jgi:DNA-binding NarL/FixJ family response regulator
MPAIRTVVADDSTVFLRSIIRFLDETPHMEVVGSARSGCEAIEQVNLLRPDLVVIDLEMPEMSGLEATRLLKSRADAPLIIMLTMHDDSAHRALAIEAKVDSFIAKRECDTELLPTIDTLFDRQSAPP